MRQFFYPVLSDIGKIHRIIDQDHHTHLENSFVDSLRKERHIRLRFHVRLDSDIRCIRFHIDPARYISVCFRPVHGGCRCHDSCVPHFGARDTRSRRHRRLAVCLHFQRVSGDVHRCFVRYARLDGSVVVFERQDPRKFFIALCRRNGYRMDVIISEHCLNTEAVRILYRPVETCSHDWAHRYVSHILAASRSALRACDGDRIDSCPVGLLLCRDPLLGSHVAE